MKRELVLPGFSNSIQKGVPLKNIFNETLVKQLASNLTIVYPDFNYVGFFNEIMSEIDDLDLKARAIMIADKMRKYLPNNYSEVANIFLNSLTPPIKDTSDLGLSGMFYLPHVCFVEKYGLDNTFNNNEDPFNLSMKLQYELTQRFSAEFSIRRYIIEQPERTFEILYKWMSDESPHVRRLCSEGTRPRLPWAQKIKMLAKDPTPSIQILEKLKEDEDLYVRRSVANHIGDIAKDNLELALSLCEKWLDGASKELKWIIRHALRYPAKKNNKEALRIRKLAK